jgi:DNA-binding MarR family transcriptional regulator
MPNTRRRRGPLSIDEYRTLARFRHALRVFERFSEQAARDAGLPPAQHQLLLAIKGHATNDAPSISDVADALQVRLHSAVELVDRAEAADLVARHADVDDARRQRLALTPRGERFLESLSLLHREELRRFREEMVDVLRELD